MEPYESTEPNYPNAASSAAERPGSPIACDFYDQVALLERLTGGLKRRPQEVVFLVGSPLSAPTQPGMPGVPAVDGGIDLIRNEFQEEPAQLAALDTALHTPGQTAYQAAFTFLHARRGQHTTNELVRMAVLRARLQPPKGIGLEAQTPADVDESCRRLEFDMHGWALTPGMEHLGKLLASYPQRFGQTVLTTNFDPLIQIAIRRAGGSCYRTKLQADGNLDQTEADGCHVIYLHGYWYGADTLHTPRQLGQPRPRLRASLSRLLRSKLVVVAAYGGWDDVFTTALMDVVRDDAAHPEIIWTFHAANPSLNALLLDRLQPGIDRGSISLYAGANCHELFGALDDRWLAIEPRSSVQPTAAWNPLQFGIAARQAEAPPREGIILEGDDEDRPPVVEFCVGRDAELDALRTSNASLVFLTGLGGQGKSTVAARYFADSQVPPTFSHYVWRDCKGESERFENQLAAIVEKLSVGRLSGQDLSKQGVETIIELLMNLMEHSAVLFVFDNADHYVNIEEGRMAGSAHVFAEALLRSPSRTRAIFTCRPSVKYDHPSALSCRLEGIPLVAAESLFARRGASSAPEEIGDAHRLTNGHAFWLDLLAIQVAKPNAPARLRSLVNEIRRGGGPLPDATLRSIWSTLHEREQIVLRAMAETVKPESELEIGDYLSHQLHYNKVSQALRALRRLNLVVVKHRPGGADLLELHPLVRHFIHQQFPGQERASYITAIIEVYKRFIGSHKGELSERPSLSTLQWWTQNAELDLTVGRVSDAFSTLEEAGGAFLASAYPREYCRVARLLLASADWAQHDKYKGFEAVVRIHVRCLSYLGENAEVDGVLRAYEGTVPEKDARYINYCEMRSFWSWVKSDFVEAVRWGSEGQTLKESGVDTEFDTSHTLALAERDAGRPESALAFFLAGRTLRQVLDPEELEEQRGGAHYGNIGRCLHLMGQIENALVCYQKSAVVIERHPHDEHVVNQGYVRQWIGELLAARDNFELAEAFLRAARLKWEQVSPPKAAKLDPLINEVRQRGLRSLRVDDTTAENIVLDWIFGDDPNPASPGQETT